MRVHGICLVKNEGDIIRLALREGAKWCDAIYVMDNGSTDGTWEIVQELARELPAVIPFRSDPRPFDDGLRAEIFREYRERATAGDWWCRLDADEIYLDDPRAFLAEVPATAHVVWSIHLQYYLTDVDLARFPETTGAPPEMQDADLPRHYRADGSEARFFRHRSGLEWQGGAWPRHLGLVHPRRIRLRHFQYRSPGQMQVRLRTRKEAEANGWMHFRHTTERSEWREQVASASSLERDLRDGRFIIDENRLPRHLESSGTRFAKRILHGLGIWP